MKKKRILVLTDDMPWGHRSIAKAIYGFLKKKEEKSNIEIDYAEVKMPYSSMNELYTFMYRYMPSSNRITNKIVENEKLKDLFLEVTNVNEIALKGVVKKYKPDLIICSYCFHSHSLVKLKSDSKTNFKLWTIVADPRTPSRLSFVSDADLNLVYDDVAYQQAIRYGISKENIFKTGWWTRQEMFQKQKNIKNDLGIEEGEPVVFIGGGSLGTNAITKFLPVLLLISQKCTIIFNTGTDKVAFKMVEQYKKIFEKIKIKNHVKIVNLGWIENMAEVLSACDIVFGKAGPNFLFDVVAVQKPFVAITHIGGQEDGNIDLILEKKLGWVKEGLGEAEDFLMAYLKNPKKFNTKFAKTIEIEAKNNEKTMSKIWEMVEK
ncbi:MAG: glycosyltransferase [Candidatus Shapirobacteria bacterium]